MIPFQRYMYFFLLRIKEKKTFSTSVSWESKTNFKTVELLFLLLLFFSIEKKIVNAILYEVKVWNTNQTQIYKWK